LASKKPDRKILVLDKGPQFSEAERSAFLARVMRDFDYGADYNDHLPESVKTKVSTIKTGDSPQFNYNRLFGTGGTALHFQGWMVRPVEADMRVKSLFGYGRDWPISYGELEPWLLDAEKVIGVAGNHLDNPYAEPRTDAFPMPAHAFSWCDREILAPALKKLGMTAHSRPMAVNSHVYDDRAECNACRICRFCPTGARYSPCRR